MVSADKIKAQKDKNILAEGYAETIALAKRALNRNKQLLLCPNISDSERARIENKIIMWNAVIKENTEIYNLLINYYFPSKIFVKNDNEKNKSRFTISAIVDEYEQGNFE